MAKSAALPMRHGMYRLSATGTNYLTGWLILTSAPASNSIRTMAVLPFVLAVISAVPPRYIITQYAKVHVTTTSSFSNCIKSGVLVMLDEARTADICCSSAKQLDRSRPM